MANINSLPVQTTLSFQSWQKNFRKRDLKRLNCWMYRSSTMIKPKDREEMVQFWRTYCHNW